MVSEGVCESEMRVREKQNYIYIYIYSVMIILTGCFIEQNMNILF